MPLSRVGPASELSFCSEIPGYWNPKIFQADDDFEFFIEDQEDTKIEKVEEIDLSDKPKKKKRSSKKAKNESSEPQSSVAVKTEDQKEETKIDKIES